MPHLLNKKTTLAILLIAPLLLHFSSILSLSLNIPWIDDFFWYFDFLKRLDSSNKCEQFIRTISTPYNGHWHILQRSILTIITRIGLPINTVYFVVIGNLLFIGLFYCLFIWNNTTNGLSLATISVAWLFFQPISHYNFFECAFFNLPVLLFTALAIEASYRDKNIAYLWAFFATFSNGNGLLIWPILILMALWHLNWKKLLITSVLFTLVAYLYFLLSHHNNSSGQLDLANIINLALYFIQLCGHILPGVETFEPWISMILGFLILIAFLLLTSRAIRNQEPLYFFMLFILMSIGIVTLTRKSVTGYSAQIVNHYLLFPQIFFGCLIYYLLQEFKLKKVVSILILTATILLSSLSYLVKLPTLIYHHSIKTANALNYEASKKWLLYPRIQGISEYYFANRSTEYSISSEYYELPEMTKNFLSESCTCQQNATGDLRVITELKQRILARELFVELTDKSGVTSFYPVTPDPRNLLDWIKLINNRRIDYVIYLHLLPEPIDAKSIVRCRLFTLKNKYSPVGFPFLGQ